jgi:GxxExxY protein
MLVLNNLKPGLDEKLYERALAIELRKRGHWVQTQVEYAVFYDSQQVGLLIPDMVIDKSVIVDAKVATEFNDSHVAKMIGYLAISELQLALLINFKYATLKWKRVVR